MAIWDQYLRRISLLVVSGDQALDLSAFRVRFKVTAQDADTPARAEITVTNLADATALSVISEYTRIILQAGYQAGNFGAIFDGTITKTRIGKESAVDSYLTMDAAAWDIPYTQGFVNQTLAAGASQADQVSALAGQMGVSPGIEVNAGGFGGTVPRGKVLFGMTRDHMNTVARTTGVTWRIENGVVRMTPIDGYLPGQIVVLTPATGLVGMPETTGDGVHVRCLLNPRIQIGTLVQLDNATINQALVTDRLADPGIATTLIATTQAQGYYKVLVHEFSGDSRGNDWYSDLTCLAADISSDDVNAYGPGPSSNAGQ